jgi:hypothetical protein
VAAAQRTAIQRTASTTSATALSSATAPSSSSTSPTGPSTLTDPTLPPFLQCVAGAESSGDYQAVSPNGLYMGAFQFSQATWNSAAEAAGLDFLVGIPPNKATKAEQDTVAIALYALDGQRPWLGDRCTS